MRREGHQGPRPSLWLIPLLGVGSNGHLRDLLPQRDRGLPVGPRTEPDWPAARLGLTQEVGRHR
jgi:hypothetical protein